MAELSKEKEILQQSAKIELFDAYLYFELIYNSVVDDDVEGKRDKYQNWRGYIQKDRIVSIDMYFVYKEDVWYVDIEADGRGQKVDAIINTQAEAEEIFKKLVKWRFE